mgnify:CR=1 FL=1|tara:strand:+ start:1829 stop:3253 length:1425 start_codon:yes stop_codon:yes gene_type:complete
MPSKKQKAAKKLQTNSYKGSRGNGITGRGPNFGYGQTGSYHYADQKRDVWTVAGYPQYVDFDMHWNMQARFGIAKAGIHRIVDKCWQSSPTITDGDFDGKRPLTKFEQDLEVLIEKHYLFARLKGVDWRNRIGRYAGILPIVTETQKTSPREPASKSRGIEALLKLVPLPESQLSVDNVRSNSDISSADYGMPEHYNLRQDVSGDRNPVENSQIQLDPSRVFIFAEGADDGSIFGIPANEGGYNSLLDLEKVCVAGAEGHYKNAKQRTVVNVKDSQVANVITSDPVKKDLWDKATEEFASGFDNFLTTFGMDIQQLQSTLADPTHPFTNSLNVYAASISIPATILIGQQTGRLASDEDQADWAQTAESRRENTLTPAIIGFLMYLVDRGIMSAPTNDITVEWESLSEPSTGEKLDNSKKMSDVNKVAFETGRGEAVFTEEEIRKGAVMDEKPKEDSEGFGEGDELGEDVIVDEP